MKTGARNLLLVITALLLLAGCGGGGGATSTPAGAERAGDTPQLGWPPETTSARQAGELATAFLGREYASSGSAASEDGDNLLLDGADGIAGDWALYSVSGLDSSNEVTDLTVNYTVTTTFTGDGTRLWVGLANFHTSRWEWHEMDLQNSWNHAYAAPSHYRSDGSAHVAVAMSGPGSVAVELVRFTHSGVVLAPPTGFSATYNSEAGAVNLGWDEMTGATGYSVYRSTDGEFSSAELLTPAPLSVMEYTDATVVIPGQYTYFASAHYPQESEPSDPAAISLVDAPGNLQGEVDLSGTTRTINLTWDTVDGATGYNVYRSLEAQFTDPVLMTPEPVETNSFQDMNYPGGKYYFYYVTAVADNESGPSNSIQLWGHTVDIPAPSNVRLDEQGPDWFRVAWGWDGPEEPDNGFMVYVDTESGFIIEDETEYYHAMGFRPRDAEFTDREVGVSYYIKLCARHDGGWGPMSDEIVALAEGFWDWSDVSVIKESELAVAQQIIMRAEGTGSEIGLTYPFGSHLRYGVEFAHFDGTDWSTEVVLPNTDRQHGMFLDLAYGGSAANGYKYLIATNENIQRDMWVVTGQPGSWNTSTLTIDGSLGAAGTYVAAAASEDELAIIYEAGLDLGASGRTLVAHTSPLATENWSYEVVEPSLAADTDVDIDLHFSGGDLFTLWKANTGPELWWGSRDGGWSWSDVRPGGTPELHMDIELARFDSQWYATGYDNNGKALYLLNGTSVPWSASEAAPGETWGRYARFAVNETGDDMVVLYYDSDAEKYRFAFHSDGWTSEVISVPGVAAYFYRPGAEIVYQNGELYFIFVDKTDYTIKCAHGVPPA